MHQIEATSLRELHMVPLWWRPHWILALAEHLANTTWSVEHPLLSFMLENDATANRDRRREQRITSVRDHELAVEKIYDDAITTRVFCARARGHPLDAIA